MGQPCNWILAGEGASFLPNVGNGYLYNGSFNGTPSEAKAIAASLGGTFFQTYADRSWLEVLNGFSHQNPESNPTAKAYWCEKKALEPPCVVTLNNQLSTATCELGQTFGCKGTNYMYTSGGCSGNFTCNGEAMLCESNGVGVTPCLCPVATPAPTPATPPPTPFPPFDIPSQGASLDIMTTATNAPLVDVLAARTDLAAFRQEIRDSGLETAIQSLGNFAFTIFAPDNQAWRSYNLLKNSPPQANETSDEKLQKLQMVLMSHILMEVRSSADLTNFNGVLQTQANTSLVFSTTAQGLMVNQSLIRVPDIAAANGVIHIIDRVLTLPTREQVAGDILAGNTSNNNVNLKHSKPWAAVSIMVLMQRWLQ